MRAASAILVISASLVLIGGAQAQAYIGLGAGFVMPTGDFSNDGTGAGYTTGWVGSVLFEVRPPHSRVGLRVEAGYSSNPANARLGADSHIEIPGGSADLIYTFPASRGEGALYLIGGGGMYHVTDAVTFSGAVTVDTSVNNFAWNLGAGMAASVGSTRPFIEARYFDVPAFSGLHVNHFALTIGIRGPLGSD